MPDSEKVIKEFEAFVNGNCPSDSKHVCNIELMETVLALLKEQEDLGTELTNAVELIHKKNERIEKLLKEQEPKTGKWERQYSKPGVYANLFWWCSVCKEPTRYNDAGIFYKYCPRCGAKLEPCRET